jgi:hypothetical protein
LLLEHEKMIEKRRETGTHHPLVLLEDVSAVRLVRDFGIEEAAFMSVAPFSLRAQS